MLSPEARSIIRSWVKFLFELLILILIIAVIVLIYRYIRAIYKRARFVTKATFYCKTNKLKLQKNSFQYLSILCNTKKPDLIMETENKRYVIKYFTPSILKNVNLSFITPNRYFITNVKGFILVAKNVGFLLRARLFKPKNIDSTFLSLTHTEITEHIKGEKRLPTISFDLYKSAEKETENILIINPIPLNVKYINKNKFDLLLSGDEYHNFKIYSSEEFLMTFIRAHEKERAEFEK